MIWILFAVVVGGTAAVAWALCIAAGRDVESPPENFSAEMPHRKT